jgi:DNA invertase Pin-like site-specific DNA recombinase
MIDAFSEFECNVIKERTKAALAAKKARGERVGGLGYGLGVDENNKIYEIPEEKQVIALIRDLRSKGRTLRKIAEKLNSQGILNKQGNPWNQWSIFRITKDSENNPHSDALNSA